MDYSEALLDDCQTLLHDIENIENARKTTSASFVAYRDALFSELSTVQNHDPETPGVELTLLSSTKLATHVYDALVNEEAYFADLIQVLAVATRTLSRLRPALGHCQSHFPEHHERSPDHLERVARFFEPDCVLEVARRVITLRYRVSSSDIGNALKVIANCCADNNYNRGLIIHRNGIETLLDLAQRDADLDTLIPALYNVCADYNEPATILGPLTHHVVDLTNPGYDLDQASEDEGETDGRHSLAVEYLAATYRSNNSFATFELLLSFQTKVSKPIMPYLAELIEMATQPALGEFELVCSDLNSSWTWSFSINHQEQDTIRAAAEFVQRDESCLESISCAFLNLISQQEARDALLKRKDDSIWTLMTLPCLHDDSTEDNDSLVQEMTPVRNDFLRMLYEITEAAAFSRNERRASMLTEKCVDELRSAIAADDQGREIWQQHPPDSSRSYLLTVACVILSQLAVSYTQREKLLGNNSLLSALGMLLEFERNPYMLYPAVTIISRMALVSTQDLTFALVRTLQKMQRLLTSGGLGLIVPFETVTAYTTSVRGRPDIIKSLLTPEQDNSTVFEATLTLWSLTVDADTRLEIGNFFLEVLRSVLLALRSDDPRANVTEHDPLRTKFRDFVARSSPQVAEVFNWVRLHAEPIPHRDQGWFGLAMLSIWPEGRPGIFRMIEQQAELRDAVLAVPRLHNRPVMTNLMLMLNELHASSAQVQIDERTRDVLKTAARNLGLPFYFGR